MNQPTQPTTPSAPLKIHQQPEDAAPKARPPVVEVRTPVTDPAGIARGIGASGGRGSEPTRSRGNPTIVSACTPFDVYVFNDGNDEEPLMVYQVRHISGAVVPGADGCSSLQEAIDLATICTRAASIALDCKRLEEEKAAHARAASRSNATRPIDKLLPLVITGQGDYRREYHPEAVEALVLAAKGVQDEANRAQAEATTGRFGIGPRAIGRIDSALGLFRPLLDRLLGRSGQPKDAASIPLHGELLDESGASAGAGFVPNVGSKVNTTA